MSEMTGDNRPRTADEIQTPCEVWGRGSFLHLCFSSVGCRYRKSGYCTMCNYGAGENVISAEALAVIDRELKGRAEPVVELLLGTCGSILDEAEMSWDTLECILSRIAREAIPTILLETHYTTVSAWKLQRIRELLPNSEVVIEMGFESADPAVLRDSLHKFMDLKKLAQTTALIKGMGMGVVLNVFLGAPYLTVREQIDDAKKAVEWAVVHDADRVVVFPSNIKPNTAIWDLYHQNRYRRISHWAVIELLSRLDDECLSRIELSWYGDRQKEGKSTAVIPPESCNDCDKVIFDFYRSFIPCFDPQRRRTLVCNIKKHAMCSCRERFCEELARS